MTSRIVVGQRRRARIVGMLATGVMVLAGCESPEPQNASPAVAGILTQSTLVATQAGSIDVSCLAADMDGTVASVTVDLSVLGGPVAQALTLADGRWAWVGSITPTSAGSKTLTFTATDDDGATGSQTATVDVRAASADELILDLGHGVVIEMVRIDAGSFEMGTASTDAIEMYQDGVDGSVMTADWANAAKPVHTVTFAYSYYMAITPTTEAQWQAIMGDDDGRDTDNDNFPIVNVSWNDANDFCTDASTATGRTIRLPSEAEWEYACKAGSGDTAYSFGNDVADLADYAWYNENSDSNQHSVGLKQPNDWGLYDMHGSVWEWCADAWHNTYAGAPTDGSAWPVGADAVGHPQRGGSWHNFAGVCRSAYRNRFEATDARADFSFRIVVAAE